MVWPSPMVMTLSAGANGNSSRKRQTPEKHKGSVRRDHLASNSVSERGGGRRSRSYATSISPLQRGQLNDVSDRSEVAPQAGSMQRWKTGSLIPSGGSEVRGNQRHRARTRNGKPQVIARMGVTPSRDDASIRAERTGLAVSRSRTYPLAHPPSPFPTSVILHGEPPVRQPQKEQDPDRRHRDALPPVVVRVPLLQVGLRGLGGGHQADVDVLLYHPEQVVVV